MDQFVGLITGMIDAWSVNRSTWLAIGLFLLGVLAVLIRSTRPSPPPLPPRSVSCLACYAKLGERSYVDRYFPNWVVCGDCFDRLPALKQREYRQVVATLPKR